MQANFFWEAPGYWENDPYADFSFDPDPVVGRYGHAFLGHAWVGRTHPLRESLRSFQRIDATDASTDPLLDPVKPYDAIGANWAQNQSNALDPRVAGWIGVGGRLHVPGDKRFFVTVNYSPIFLPSFGPKLTLSDKDAPTGSRFARLPPLYANFNGAVLPLRYTLRTGSLEKIVRQDQFFTSIGYRSFVSNSKKGDDTSTYYIHSADFMFWSAPSPSPEIDPSGVVRIVDTNVNIHVTARPYFPRQNFFAVRYGIFRQGIGVELASAMRFMKSSNAKVKGGGNFEADEMTLSIKVRPSSFITFGGLHGFSMQQDSKVGADIPTFTNPRFDRNLVWLHLGANITDKIYPSLFIQQHLGAGQLGNRVSPQAQYRLTKNINLTARADILTGSDRSYFGTWRHLDSVRLIARLVW